MNPFEHLSVFVAVIMGLDLEAHFIEHRSAFFGVLLIAALLDLPETVMKEQAGLRPVPLSCWIAEPVWLLIPVAGLLTPRRRVQHALPVVWVLAS